MKYLKLKMILSLVFVAQLSGFVQAAEPASSKSAWARVNCGGPISPKGYFVPIVIPPDDNPPDPQCPKEPVCPPVIDGPQTSVNGSTRPPYPDCPPIPDCPIVDHPPIDPDGPTRKTSSVGKAVPGDDGSTRSDEYVQNRIRMNDRILAAYYPLNINLPLPSLRKLRDADLDRFRKIEIKCEETRRKIISDNYASFNMNNTYLGWDTDWMYSSMSIEPYTITRSATLQACNTKNQPCSTDANCCSGGRANLKCDVDLKSCQPTTVIKNVSATSAASTKKSK